MPDVADLVERRQRLLGDAYRLFYDEPVHIVRGEGVWLFDAGGRRYLDAYNNVACVGHCHPRVVKAIADQAAMLNTHTRYLGEALLDYAERLLTTFDGAMDHLMLTCTGSEANDLALRIARAHTGADGVIVTANAYHGATAATAALSPSLGPGRGRDAAVRTVPDPRSPERFVTGVRSALAGMAAEGLRPAALLLDPLFVGDGIVVDTGGSVATAVDAVRAAGGVFIADEVHSGFGRTGGRLWGYARHGVRPDIVTMGKPMANGHPVGGVAVRHDVLAAFAAEVRYFNTFGGNPVSCAAATAVLDVLDDERILDHVGDVGPYLADRLREVAGRHDAVAEVRAAGLMAGVEISGDGASRIVNALRRRGVLIGSTGPDGNVLKIRPPLVFGRRHADLLVEELDAVLGEDR